MGLLGQANTQQQGGLLGGRIHRDDLISFGSSLLGASGGVDQYGRALSFGQGLGQAASAVQSGQQRRQQQALQQAERDRLFNLRKTQADAGMDLQNRQFGLQQSRFNAGQAQQDRINQAQAKLKGILADPEATDEQKRQALTEYSASTGDVRTTAGLLGANQPQGPKLGKPFTVMQDGKQVLVQQDQNGQLVPVEGYSPLAANQKGDEKTFNKISTLRKEYIQQTKDFQQINASYGNIKAAATDPSAAGDIALLTSYMKMIDPGSVVREGEFATAQNAAGVPDRVRAYWNNLQKGERLTPKQRKDFVGRAGGLYKSRLKNYKQVGSQYTKLAERYGFDPRDVVLDYVGQTDQPTPQANVAVASNQARAQAVPAAATPTSDPLSGAPLKGNDPLGIL